MTPAEPYGLSRRRLLQAVAAAAVVLPVVTPDSAYAGADIQRDTLDAWADTIVPGAKRSPTDRAVAGATGGPGAVQAGSYDLYVDPDVGLTPVLPALVTLINTEALAYAAVHGKVLNPFLAPFVALDFASRTAIVESLVAGPGVVGLLWYALAALAMLAFHTAGQLDTAAAISAGHPGLAWIGFPAPDPDGIWRFPEFSYGTDMAAPHPLTTATGNPS